MLEEIQPIHTQTTLELFGLYGVARMTLITMFDQQGTHLRFEKIERGLIVIAVGNVPNRLEAKHPKDPKEP